jgi:hypothetical protein
LFSRTINLIRERFGFYHAAIFIVEETGFNAILRGTGDAGERMKDGQPDCRFQLDRRQRDLDRRSGR